MFVSVEFALPTLIALVIQAHTNVLATVITEVRVFVKCLPKPVGQVQLESCTGIFKLRLGYARAVFDY